MTYVPVDERLKYDTPEEALGDYKHVYRESVNALSCPHDGLDIHVNDVHNFCPSCGASLGGDMIVKSDTEEKWVPG